MKCTIITHPPGKNYGGILQAYALSSAVSAAGHETVILNGPHKTQSFFKRLSARLKRCTGKDKEFRFANLQRFTAEKLPVSPRWYGEYIPLGECVIVGSDQVWRPEYAVLPGAYFLDFIPETEQIKRIAYAASFGVDSWNFTPEQTEQYGKLLKKFDAVSVRETSGVELCREHWNIESFQMPDPTLLHDAGFYRSFTTADNAGTGKLFTYFLDPDEEKLRLAKECAAKLGVEHFDFLKSDKKSPMLPVEDFLSGISGARMVLTDSFHGMVFSMIFNVPFAVLGNAKRGMTRFQLAAAAGAQKALLTPPLDSEFCCQLANDPSVFAGIPSFLAGERQRGREFLQKHLGGNFICNG